MLATIAPLVLLFQAETEAVGEGLLLPVIGGVMLITLCALALGLSLGRRPKRQRRKPKRNPFESPVPETPGDPTEHPEV